MTAIYNMAKLDFYTTKSQNSMYLSLAMVLGLFALMGIFLHSAEHHSRLVYGAAVCQHFHDTGEK